MITERINIDVRPGGVPIVVHVTQYEVGLRTFEFVPFTSSGEWTDVTGSATLEGTKPDGNAFQQACTYVDGIVTYVLHEQLCAVSGRVWSRLVIRNIDGDMIGMTAIVWDVGEAGVKDDAVMSDSDISALRQFLDEFGTIDAYRGALNGALAAVGGPLVAATASAMTDTTKVYVYTGSESGYTEGHWYYWNGSAWTDGGVYQSTGINTDKTLTVEDMAADAKATGDAVAELKNDFINFKNDITTISYNPTWTNGRLSKATGNLAATESTKYAYSEFIETSSDVEIKIADGYSAFVWKCDYAELGHPVRDVSSGYSSNDLTYEYDSIYKYIVACVKKTDNTDITPTEASNAVSFSAESQTIFATKQALSDQNTSLTNAYTAADAVIKSEVDDVSETLEKMLKDEVWNNLDITWALGQVTRSNGLSVLVESTKFAYSGFVPVSDDATITIADGYLGFAWYTAYNEFGHGMGNISSGYNSGTVTYDYNPTFPYVIICVKRSDNAVITPIEAKTAVSVSAFGTTIFATKERVEQIADSFDDFTEDIIYTKQTANWTQGRLLKSNNNLTYSASTKYAYSDFITAISDEQIIIADGYNGFVWSCQYNELGHPVYDVSSRYASGTVNYTYNSTYKYIIACVRKNDNTDITTQEANQAVVFVKKEKTIFATKERVEQIAENTGSLISITPTKGQVCYLGDTKSNSGYICNAIAYDDGVIIAARSNGTVVRIGYSGTEETLLSLTGSLFDWRCLWMDSNENVYASPHASWGEMSVSDRGLYRLAKGGSSFTKVLSLYDASSQVTTEAQNNDDTIWTMCEDADGNLYAGVYAHTVRANPAIYKSTDGGLTWTYVFNFNTSGLTTNGKHIHTIIFSKWQNALYCIVGEVNTIFKSTDGSETWTDLHVTLTVKGSSMLATEYGIFVGSDGAYNCDIDILYPDDKTHKRVYRGWANTVFAIRQSDVTGILYAFTKIDSSVNSLAYYPPVEALTDPDEITSWLASESATHKTEWQAYYNSMIDTYPDDAIRPQHYCIIASRDGGMTWSPVKIFESDSTSANGCWTTGFFMNGECLTGRMENHASIKPVIISEGKHKYVSGGCDLDGEIFVRTNASTTNELI